MNFNLYQVLSLSSAPTKKNIIQTTSKIEPQDVYTWIEKIPKNFKPW